VFMVYVMSEQMECVGDMQVRIAWALCVVHVRLERSAEGVRVAVDSVRMPACDPVVLLV